MEKNIPFENRDPQPVDTKKDVEPIRQTIGSFGSSIMLNWPTDFLVVTQPFGVNPELHSQRNLPSHEGLDIRAPLNSKVYACADGVVETVHTRVEDGSPYGRYVIILHKDGYRTLYGHLGTTLVSKDQNVKGGTVIGNAAPTGQTTGGHIHLSLFQRGATAKGLTHFPDDIIDPTPFLSFTAKPPDISTYPWPIARCLAGVHVNEGSPEITFSTKYIPEALLLKMDSNKESIVSLKKANPTLFLMSQLDLRLTKRALTAPEWAAWVRPFVQRHVEAGVGYFAVLRAPNLITHGYGVHWASGKEFSRWWMDAVSLLKINFPTTKFGFPGLAPGPQITGQRLDAANFMEGADEAILNADWVSTICNWSSPREMLGEDKGTYYTILRRYYPDQLIFITEFGSLDSSLDPSARANEAARYIEIVKNQAGIGAAFARNLTFAKTASKQ